MANTVSLLSYANTFGDWVVTTNALVRENNSLAANNYTKSTGTLYLSDPTLGLQVANNAIVAGQLQVQGIGSSARIQNNLTVTQGQVYFQNTTLGLTNTGELISNGKISAAASGIGLAVSNNATIGGNTGITGYTTIGSYLTVGSNSAITGATVLGSTLSVTGATTMFSTLSVVNNIVGGSSLTIQGDTLSSSYTANNSSNTGTLFVRNGGVINGSLSVSGSSYQNNITANNTVYTPILNASNYATVNGLTSNTIIRTTTSNISGTEYVDTIVANSSITVPSLTVTSGFNACNATLSANTVTVGTGGLSVIGNFTINGTTIYNTPTFTLSALTPNQNSFLNVYRTPGANASLKWDNSNVAWYVADVNSGANSYYYKVLSSQQLTDSVSTANSTLVATATAVKTVQDNVTTANTSMKSYVDTANTSLKSYVDNTLTTANTSLKSYVDNNITIIQNIDNTQNTRLTVIEGTNVSQNARMTIIEGTDVTQNTRLTVIEGTNVSQNARMTIIEGTDVTQNTRMTNIESVDTAQNVRLTVIEGTDVGQNNRMSIIESSVTTQTNNLTATNGKMQSGYNQANTGTVLAQAGFDTANNRVSSVSGTAGRISSTGGLTPTLDLIAAGPGVSSVTNASLTIDVYGRVTALSSGSAPVTYITGTASQITVTGTTTPTISLPQSIATGSSVQFGSFGVGTAASGTTGEIRAADNITAYYSSDKKFKENIEDIPNAIETVNGIGGKLFDWTDAYLEAHGGQDDYFNQKSDFGVIAQDVQSVFPRAVRTRPDGSLAVDYEKLVALAFAAIKELSDEIKELKKK